MVQISKLSVNNFEGAIRGMRNPYKNTQKSDSLFGLTTRDNFLTIIDEFLETDAGTYQRENKEALTEFYFINGLLRQSEDSQFIEYALIGQKDLALIKRLAKAGTPHNKFMRQIGISMDIRAPLYYWKEADTYKVGTTANSESTMHTIITRPFVLSDFSADGSFYDNIELTTKSPLAKDCLTVLKQDLVMLNTLRDYYINEKDMARKEMIWRTIIQKLPCSYMQLRTWTGNYSILHEVINQREGHKLTEWTEDFIKPMHSLPYADELIFIKGE